MDKAGKVLLGPSSFASADQAPLNRLNEAGFEVVDNPYKRKLTKDELLVLLADDITGIIAGLETLDREVFCKSRLKVVSRCGSGLSNVDLDAAKELGVIIRSTPLAPAVSVAELALGALLALVRRLPEMDRDLHERKWSKRMGRQLKGMRVAVVGLGNIGRRTAALLKAFEVKVAAVDPAYLGRLDEIDVVSLDEALSSADAVILHCSGEKPIIGERELSLMKDGVYLLNAARGGLVDERALKQALDAGRVAGAWLDAFLEEPYIGDLCAYSQVLLTPHIGSYTVECRRDMEMEAVENLVAAFAEL